MPRPGKKQTEETGFEYVKRVLKHWPETWSLLIAAAGWWLLPRFLLWLDPTSVRIDDGIWQIPVIAMIMMLIFSSFAFAGIKFNFPQLWKKYVDQLDGHSDDSQWSSPWLLVGIYATLVGGCVLLVMAIA